MSHSETEQEAIAYLLGELDERQTAAFEKRMANDKALSSLVGELEESLGDLALSQSEIKEPNNELADRIVRSLPDKPAKKQQAAPAKEKNSEKIASFPMISVLGWAAAACFLILFIVQWRENQTLDRQLEEVNLASLELSGEIETLSKQLADLGLERSQLQELVSNLRSQRTLDQIQIAALNSELDQLYHGFAIWDASKDEGVVRVYNLPEIDSMTQNYQMWVISDQSPNPINGGVFSVNETGSAEYRFAPGQPIDNVVAFAISLEKKGGVPAPEGDIYLSGGL